MELTTMSIDQAAVATLSTVIVIGFLVFITATITVLSFSKKQQQIDLLRGE